VSSAGDLGSRVAGIRDRIATAAARAGREASAVRLMAITKTFPRSVVEEALAAGLVLFGENRVGEASAKFAGLTGACELHLVGHLQRNKAAAAAGLFACVQSIDRPETAASLARHAAAAGRVMDVLIEYNTSGEASKSGVTDRDGLLACLDAVQALAALRLRGLMTVGPFGGDTLAVRRSFSLLHRLFEEVRADRKPEAFDTLSMGMSGDFEAAVEEGATLVRLGTALFGART
jgi:pyridoxal phosphate enzyme (YggS family)